ncbi:Bifunctional epoxide hydrolase 2 [Strongyloides ratti]|uniref:Bifunctional epoxide hydrolase 2 n=1 Tax=Strongyloides ratti TaxID=34506 RepID=A0A090LSH7_STRRB|nr:Bifunctional epoxide hydrolase 2 [Strongyloides ratti]CEF70563.1 Bifunctional epoxide hydrolase 2 [Strongyloides ratti]
MAGVIMKYTNSHVAEDAQNPESNNLIEYMEALELGNYSVEELIKLFPDNHPLKIFASSIIDSNDLESSSLILSKDENFSKCIQKLKKKGYKIALITNNFYIDKDKKKTVIIKDISDFDVVVESCKVGMRKPNPEIYVYTLALLNVKPDETVFVDDLKINCQGAKNIGIKTIHVQNGDTKSAVNEIKKLSKNKILNPFSFTFY